MLTLCDWAYRVDEPTSDKYCMSITDIQESQSRIDTYKIASGFPNGYPCDVTGI